MSPETTSTVRRSVTRRRSMHIAGACAILVLVAAACGSDDAATDNAATDDAGTAVEPSGDVTYPAGKEEVCQARDDLRAGVTGLADAGLLTSGTDAIDDAVDDVRSDLDALAAAAEDDYATEVDAVRNALDGLEAAVDEAGDGGPVDNVTAIGTAIAELGTTATALFSEVESSCGL